MHFAKHFLLTLSPSRRSVLDGRHGGQGGRPGGDVPWWGGWGLYGFYLRHVHGIRMTDIQTRTLTPDQRPAIALDDVSGAHFTGLDTQQAPSVPVFSLKAVMDLQLRQV